MRELTKYVEISKADVVYITTIAEDIQNKYKKQLLEIIREEMLKTDDSWYGDLRFIYGTTIQYVTSLDECGKYYDEMEIPIYVLESELISHGIKIVSTEEPNLDKYKDFE